MQTKKEKFVQKYETLMTSIVPKVKAIPNFEHLFRPHIPGVGDNYWDNYKKPKIAFVGKDVGVGKTFDNSLDNIQSFILFTSELMNDADILNWNLNYGQFATSIIFLLSKIYNVQEADILEGKRNDLLSSFVWAQRHSILNYDSSRKENLDLPTERWQKLKDACEQLDSLKLLIETTEPDIIIVSCWDINGYFDVPSYKVIKEDYHLKLLKKEDERKYIIHTCHQTHWKSDYQYDPFYSRLDEILLMLKNDINIDDFFA